VPPFLVAHLPHVYVLMIDPEKGYGKRAMPSARTLILVANPEQALASQKRARFLR
jgi:hypothetical protein